MGDNREQVNLVVLVRNFGTFLRHWSRDCISVDLTVNGKQCGLLSLCLCLHPCLSIYHTIHLQTNINKPLPTSLRQHSAATSRKRIPICGGLTKNRYRSWWIQIKRIKVWLKSTQVLEPDTAIKTVAKVHTHTHTHTEREREISIWDQYPTSMCVCVCVCVCQDYR